MKNISAQFVGVELYFEDLGQARRFYVETLGLQVSGDNFTRSLDLTDSVYARRLALSRSACSLSSASSARRVVITSAGTRIMA
jgi:catechol-2,3-dioxygenase